MSTPAVVAAALSDASRVRIVEVLAAAPARTSELAERIGCSVPALSRHLRVLRDAAVVERVDVDEDGRGRRYRLRPGALDGLSGWLHLATWSDRLRRGTDEPQAAELLGRMGGFLDAFGRGDVAFFERHLRDDAVLVFPELPEPIDKAACLASVTTHPPWLRHRVTRPPTVHTIGPAATVLTFTAAVRHRADHHDRHVTIGACFAETDPWQIVHLQWTTTAPPDPPTLEAEDR